jgi:DNA-binding transcriptional regulator YiaG
MEWTPEAIKELMSKLGLTQQQLAGKIGVTVTSVGNWVNGRFLPSGMAKTLLNKLAKKGAKV